jgi:hypothetical protein
LLREGFTEDDIKNQSDKLVDAICAWGTLDTVRGRIKEHLDAGASHVSVQVLTEGLIELPSTQWRELATLLPEFR